MPVEKKSSAANKKISRRKALVNSHPAANSTLTSAPTPTPTPNPISNRTQTQTKDQRIGSSLGPRSRIQDRLPRILELLSQYYPNPECALIHESPWQLLIATILSAQCTDERVNQVTPQLFARHPNPRSMAKADLAELEILIRSTGFYKNKAKSLQLCSKALCEEYNGEVPRQLEALVKLAGVGRKTANVVLGVAYGIPSGIVVDTHVTRLVNRLGIAHGENAVQLEQALLKIVPKQHWIEFSHWLILHGRAICKARSPRCEICFLAELCPKEGVVRKREAVRKGDTVAKEDTFAKAEAFRKFEKRAK